MSQAMSPNGVAELLNPEKCCDEFAELSPSKIPTVTFLHQPHFDSDHNPIQVFHGFQISSAEPSLDLIYSNVHPPRGGGAY